MKVAKKRVVLSISVPPDTAKEYRNIAGSKGVSNSQFFREMFNFFNQEKLKKDFLKVQGYGARKVKALKINEKEIEKLIFEGH